MRSRSLLLIAAALVLPFGSLAAQAHATHRHPSGAKIIMLGTLVDPFCAFARQLADTAQARCAHSRSQDQFHPALLTSDGELYVLAFDTGGSARKRSAVAQQLVGKQVKVDGTVFPAGDTYLIVVDSLQVNRENH
jgi:hypothetical protein